MFALGSILLRKLSVKDVPRLTQPLWQDYDRCQILLFYMYTIVSIIIEKEQWLYNKFILSFFKNRPKLLIFGTLELKQNLYYKMSVCLWQALDLEHPNHWTYVDQICTKPIFWVNMYVLVCKKIIFEKSTPIWLKKTKNHFLKSYIGLSFTCYTLSYISYILQKRIKQFKYNLYQYQK